MSVRVVTAAAAALALALSLSPRLAGAASPGQAVADRGAALYRAGRYEAAREAFREAVRLDPGLVKAWEDLGWAERRLGHGAEALRIWRNVLRLEPGRAGAAEAIASLEEESRHAAELARLEEQRRVVLDRMERGDDAYRRESYADAEREYRAAIELLPSSLPLQLKLGWAVRRRGGLEEAIEIWKRVAEAEGAPLQVHRYLASAQVEAGRLDDARASLAQLPDDYPGKLQALAQIAADEGGRLDEAIGLLARALALHGPERAVLRDLGSMQRSAGRLDQAEATWRRYASAFPREPEAHELLAQLHLDRQEWAEALSESRAALALDPARKSARVRVVRSLFGLSRIAEARQLATDLAASYPDDVQAQHLLAHALTKSRDHPAAARQWRRVLEIDPRSAVAQQNWIRALYDAGEADEAVRQGRALAASRDAPPAILQLLAEDAAGERRFAEAAGWYRTLTERFPDEPQHWRSLGLAYGEEGRTADQLAVARQALGRMPDRLDLQLDLATALADAGRWDEALGRSRRLAADYPDKPAVHRLLLAALAETGRTREALSTLATFHPSFLKDYEVRTAEAKLRSDSGDFEAARALLDGLARTDPETRFVPILLYHGVVEHDRTLQTPAARFDDQMKALVAAGYAAITLSELARMVDGRLPFPPRPVLITFDDARADAFEVGDPILARHGLKATMFVPTGPIGDDDAFHAGWETLVRHERSGRWEMQSHGRDAHTPVRIDRGGHKGEFLVYRAWLDDLGRRETFAEYRERLDREYARAKRDLEQRFPGRPILGFAYPLNEIGPAEVTPDAADRFVNETVSRRHFRFGLVQDGTGYNALRPDGKAPFMLRRFEVPRDWSGAQLLAHLAANEPRRAARLALARLEVDRGRPEAARSLLGEIAREEPFAAPACERVLADVAWEEDLPREAAAHLAASPPPPVSSLGRGDTLDARLPWSNDPRTGASAVAFTDTDRRSVVSTGARFRYPLRVPVDLDLGAGTLWIEDRRYAARSSGTQVSATADAKLGVHVDLAGWGRHRELSGAPRSVNGGLEARLRLDQHRFSLVWSHEDVEAALALAKGIAQDGFSAGYDLDAARWRAEASGRRLLYEDGNRRSDLHAAVLARTGPRASWSLGGSLDYEDSAFAPAAYYAPRELVEAMARATFSRRWRDSSSLSADLRLGAAHDLTHDLRPAAHAMLRFSRWWGARRRLATSVDLSGSAVPGYGSVAASLGLDWRL